LAEDQVRRFILELSVMKFEKLAIAALLGFLSHCVPGLAAAQQTGNLGQIAIGSSLAVKGALAQPGNLGTTTLNNGALVVPRPEAPELGPIIVPLDLVSASVASVDTTTQPVVVPQPSPILISVGGGLVAFVPVTYAEVPDLGYGIAGPEE
jgi:hypothetical protein